MGLTDAACIDLETFERLSTDLLTFDKLALTTCKGVDVICEQLEKGSALPTIIVIEAFNPATEVIGRAYLADLGGCLIVGDGISMTNAGHVKGGSLEKSSSHLLSCLIDMQQPASTIDMNKYPLTAVLSHLFTSGHCSLTVCLDVTLDGSVRSLANGLSMAECIRSLRSMPTCRLRDPSPTIISQLQEDNQVLLDERRSAQSQIKHLKTKLCNLEESRSDLQQQMRSQQTSSELERFEVEYMLSVMELEAVSLKDEIRLCNLKLVQAEQQACAHGLQSAELVELNVIKQRQIDLTHQRLKSCESELSNQINTLSAQLSASSAALQAAQIESRRLSMDVKTAHDRISSLNHQLEEATRSRESAQARADAGSPVRQAQEKEIQTLRRQLEHARGTEEKLNAMLAKNDARAEAHRQVLADLERQLNELRQENQHLTQHKQRTNNHDLEEQSNQQQMTLTLAKMEADWKAERDAMKSLLNEFKKSAFQPNMTERPKVTVAPPPPPSSSSSSPPQFKPNKKQPITKKKQAEKLKSTKAETGGKEQAASKKLPGKSTNTVTVASILPPTTIEAPINDSYVVPLAVNIAATTAAPHLTKKKPSSPVKLWKPASFLPNLSKRPTVIKDNMGQSENAPFLANLTFGDDQRTKRIKLPSKADQTNFGDPTSQAQVVKPSIFRSNTASNNPLASDPSLLPSIIANFNVKIPPKKK